MLLKLVEKVHLVDNVWAFRFTPSEPMSWIPGQFIRVELPHDNPDKEGTKRWFTVSSAPSDEFMQITTRVTNSTFKHALAALNVGDTMPLIDKPDGDFTWQNTSKPLVFLAGGIGITPFYSILKQRFHDSQPLTVTLVYGGRTQDLPFKAELDKWAAADDNFTVRYIIGEPMTVQSLTALLPDLNESLVYLSGPEPMVEALGDQLKAHGLVADQLKQDFFPNYTQTNY